MNPGLGLRAPSWLAGAHGSTFRLSPSHHASKRARRPRGGPRLLTEYALHYPKLQKQVVLVTVKRSAETCEYRNPGPSGSRTHGHPEAVMSAAALWISVLQS